jgi:DNA repair protein RadD
MIAQGYLSPLVSRAGHAEADLSSVHTRAGEFVQDELASAMDNAQLVDTSCSEIAILTRERKSVLIFCTSVEHCKHMAEVITRHSGKECAVVTGETSGGDRPEMTDALMFAIESGPLTSPAGGYHENIGDDELPF